MSDDGPSASSGQADLRGRGALEQQRRCIAFEIGGALYGVDMKDVQEVIGLLPLSRVFHSPPAVLGVASLRGDVLPIVDLRLLLGETTPIDLRADRVRVVVVGKRKGDERRLGLCVEALAGLRDLPDGEPPAAPSTIASPLRDVLRGVLTDAPPCALLDPEAIFESSAVVAIPGGTRG